MYHQNLKQVEKKRITKMDSKEKGELQKEKKKLMITLSSPFFLGKYCSLCQGLMQI
jgi:6-phosphogluconate dehydrogenase